MNKRTFNLGAIVCVLLSGYLLYYVLILNDSLPFSIETVIASIAQKCSHTNIIVFGLMPVYIALMMFGTAMLSIYLGSILQRWIIHFFSKD